MKVRFILKFQDNEIGDKKDVSKAVGDKLIYRGIAEKVRKK